MPFFFLSFFTEKKRHSPEASGAEACRPLVFLAFYLGLNQHACCQTTIGSLQARIFCLTATAEFDAQHLPIMNAIFAARGTKAGKPVRLQLIGPQCGGN
jgi:hypothetical protein